MEISVNNSSNQNSILTTKSKSEETQKESFSQVLEQSKQTSKAVTISKQDTTKSLVEDILSVLRTGFTKEELEYIEKLLQAIREKIEEESKKRKVSQGEIEAMFKEVEKAILELKKSRTGEAVIKSPEDKTALNESDKSILAQFQERLKTIQTVFEDMQKGADKKKSQLQSYDELKLIQELR